MDIAVRKPTSERQREIVLAVLRIIGDRGVSTLTAATIAEEIGVTSGALFRHYDSLDDIYRAVIDYAKEIIETTFPDESLQPIDRIIALAHNRVEMLGASPGLAWLMHAENTDSLFPQDALAELWDITRRSKAFILRALREGVKSGTIRDDIDTDIMLVFITGTMHSLIGMPGVRQTSNGADSNLPNRVLLALGHLLHGSNDHYTT